MTSSIQMLILRKRFNLKCIFTINNTRSISFILSSRDKNSVHLSKNLFQRKKKTLFFTSNLSSYIPPPVIEQLAEPTLLAEPTFQSLDLGLSLWPTSWIRFLLEGLHIDCHLPWFATILVASIVLRCIIIPASLFYERKRNVKSTHFTVIRYYTERIRIAQTNRDHGDLNWSILKLKKYMDDNKILEKTVTNPLRMVGMTLNPLTIVQPAVLITTFSAIRSMVNLPVPSLTTGGCLWFLDLTTKDPFFILPILLGATMPLILITGADGIQLPGSDMKSLKKKKLLMFGLPVFVSFVLSFQSAGFQIFFLAANVMSLLSNQLVNLPAISKHIKKIEAIIDPKDLERIENSTNPDNAKEVKKKFKQMFNRKSQARLKPGWEQNADLAHKNRFLDTGKRDVGPLFNRNPKLFPDEKPINGEHYSLNKAKKSWFNRLRLKIGWDSEK